MRKPILLLSLLLVLPAAAARSAWLTVGDAAYQHVRAVPGTRMHAARQADPAFGAGSEGVYLLEVPSTSVPRLSRLLHAKLKHCGGFMQHPDEATARAALVQAPQVMAAEARPSYAISSQAIVTPALAAMDAAQIASVNTSLAAVDAMGVKLGETVLTTTSLPEDIARAQAQVNYLQEIRDDLKNNPRKIEVNVDGALDPNAVAKQIIQLVKQYTKKRGHDSNDFD